MNFLNTILAPIEVAEAYVMVFFHWLATLVGIPATSGWSWAIGIIGLTAVVRLLLVPLFVKQIHASRRMQLIQPEQAKIQAKYKGKTDPESRQAMTQETMDLYKRTGTNPFASCLPILFQSPFFFALFQVLNNLKGDLRGQSCGDRPDHRRGRQAGRAVDPLRCPAVELVHVLDLTEHEDPHRGAHRPDVVDDLHHAAPADAQEHARGRAGGPFAQQQKILLYVLPLIFAVSGVNFPSASCSTGSRRTSGRCSSSSTSSGVCRRPVRRPRRRYTSGRCARVRRSPSSPCPACTGLRTGWLDRDRAFGWSWRAGTPGAGAKGGQRQQPVSKRRGKATGKQGRSAAGEPGTGGPGPADS